MGVIFIHVCLVCKTFILGVPWESVGGTGMELLDIIRQMPTQIREAVQLANSVVFKECIDHVVFAGMGGSGIPAAILSALLSHSAVVPFVPIKGYTLPGFVNDRTLMIAISYSGNTEETLALVRAAHKRKARLLFVTSGGKLRNLAYETQAKVIEVPRGLPPRSAIAYFIFPLLITLHNSRLAKIDPAEIKSTLDSLDKPVWEDKAKAIADQLQDSIPLIYASEKYASIALRWKQQFNENAKIHAFTNFFPELNHNELMAYAKKPGNYHVLLLRDERDLPQMSKRINATKDLIRRVDVPITELALKGQSLLTKFFTALYLGDLTSYFLAKNRGVDPIEVGLIDELKRKL